MPFWSSVSIEGKPKILLVDASENRDGWESEFCGRLFRSLYRSNLQMCGPGPISVQQGTSFNEDFNIILCCTHDGVESWIETLPGLSKILFCLCNWESYDPETSRRVLDSHAASAIVPESSATPRETGLFYLKFFTELDLHSKDQISGKMIWFSFAKAKELLKKRRYSARFNVRC